MWELQKEVTRSCWRPKYSVFYLSQNIWKCREITVSAWTLYSTTVACGVACVHIVSMFVCLKSVIAFQEVRDCLFHCSRMVKQTQAKAKKQMQTRPKIYLKGNEKQYTTNTKGS